MLIFLIIVKYIINETGGQVQTIKNNDVRLQPPPLTNRLYV